jgi:hypothetical protein
MRTAFISDYLIIHLHGMTHFFFLERVNLGHKDAPPLYKSETHFKYKAKLQQLQQSGNKRLEAPHLHQPSPNAAQAPKTQLQQLQQSCNKRL